VEAACADALAGGVHSGRPDRRGPARLRSRLVRTTREGGPSSPVRRRRTGPRHAAPRGGRARPRRRSHRHRWSAAHRRAHALGPARSRPDTDSGAAATLRWLGSSEALKLIDEARIFRPLLVARFVFNRCVARSVIARETAERSAEHEPPVLAARIGQRVAFVDAAQSVRLVFEIDEAHPATREIDAFAIETAGLAP